MKGTFNIQRNKLLTMVCILFSISSYSHSQTMNSFIDEDKYNTGKEYEYTKPAITENFWTNFCRNVGNYTDIKNGDILKNIPARSEWISKSGLYHVWIGYHEYIFNLLIVTGGQIMLQRKECEPEKGIYNNVISNSNILSFDLPFKCVYFIKNKENFTKFVF